MVASIRILEKAFDVVTYVKQRAHKVYGPNIAIDCPVCDKKLKLWVLTTEKADGTPPGTFTCYYCGEHGVGPLDLIQTLEQCTKPKAIDVLVRGEYHKDNRGLDDLRNLVMNTLHDVADLDAEWEPIKPVGLPAEFIAYEDAPQKPRYFAQRGISAKRAVRYGLGFCERGFYANRLIVPVTRKGVVQFFLARYMKPTPPKGVKKSIYPMGSRPNHALFNYDHARHESRIILVEDVFSAMAIGRSAVATFGTTLSQYQLEDLLKSNARELVLLWDRDATVRHGKEYKAGDVKMERRYRKPCDKPRCVECRRYEKTWQLVHRLAEFWRVRVVQLPDERDPDELDRAHLAELIDSARVLDAGDAFEASILSGLP